MLGLVFGYVQWKLGHLESSLWHRGAPHELAASRHFLEGLANVRILASWQARAQGLLGDLAYHQGNFEEAFDCYTESTQSLMDAIRSSELVLVATPIFVGASREVAEGFSDYQSSPPPLPPLDETGLNWKHPADALTASRWQAFLAIPGFDQNESSWFRYALQDENRAGLDMKLIAEICAVHAPQIEALCQLDWPLIPPNPDAFDAVPKMADSARLLMLDAVRRAHGGDMEGAIQSFDAAYAMLRSFEYNPQFLTLEIALGIRKELFELFETAEGEPLRELFQQEQRLDPSFWENMTAGEYQVIKQVLEKSFRGKGQQANRVLDLALAKHHAYWQEVRAHGPSPKGGPSMQEVTSRWFFKFRRFIQGGHKGNRADGRQAAAELEDMRAETIHQIGRRHLGSLHEEMLEVIELENGLLR